MQPTAEPSQIPVQSPTGHPQEPEVSRSPVVYMTKDISSEGLMAVYRALGASPEGKVAVKISIGEPGSNYLRTDLIGGRLSEN